jgi:ABC-2 type transport system ATP-binding protein
LAARPARHRIGAGACSATGATVSAVPVIETEGLTKYYGQHRGIEDVTISVRSAEIFGLLGPNGAGKTTAIRTLLDLIHPTDGSARIFGLDSRSESVAIRARLGNLPGDFGYGKATSGREALRLLARLRGIQGSGRAEALAARFRADLDRPLGQLSSGLDPLMQEEFLALVEEERERGCAVFISSHELDEVERVCDRVGIVRDGKVVAVERMSDLLGKAPRRKVTVRFSDTYRPQELSDLPGVSDLEVDDHRASFRVEGDLDPVIKALARHHVTDIEAAHPTLEEVFLGYYSEEARP